MRKLSGAVLLVAALFVFLGPPKKHLPVEPSSSGAGGDLVTTISRGEKVELAQHLYPGRYTVVAFHADW